MTSRHLLARRALTLATYLFLFLAILVSVFPFYWIVTTSFKFSRPLLEAARLLPGRLHAGALRGTLLQDRGQRPPLPPEQLHYRYPEHAVRRRHQRSSRICAGEISFGRRQNAVWHPHGRMLPPVILVIPLFLIYRTLHLNDTYIGLVLAYAIFNGPLAVWLLMAFFEDFPTEIIDASLVDGSTEFQALLRVVVPLMAPSVVVVALFCFLTGWNDLIFVLTLGGQETHTLNMLMVSLLNAPSNESFGPAAATVVLGIIPPFALTLFLQRYLAAGLSLGGVKG